MSGVVSCNHGFSARIVQIPGPPNLLHSGYISCSPSLQASSETKKCHFSLSKNFQCHGCTRPSSQRGSPLMEGSPSRTEWPGSVSGSSRSGDTNPCLRQRMGGILSGSKNRGSMVLPRKRLHINCLELLADSLAVKTFTKSKVCAHADGQYVSSYIRKQNGGYLFENASEISNQSVVMVFPKSFDGVSTAPPRAFECESQQGVQGFRRLKRLEVEPQHFPGSANQVGSIRSRPFCIPTDKTIAQIRQLEARPNGNLHGCFLPRLGENHRVCVSLFALIGRCVRQIRVQKVDQLVLVAPMWPTQPWYPCKCQWNRHYCFQSFPSF